LIQTKQKPTHNFPVLFSLAFFVSVFGLKLAGQKSGTSAPRQDTEAVTANRCDASMFQPNYAAEVSVFESVRWQRFPITIWIDPLTVQDPEEMSSLRDGLSSWSKATGGILGVLFLREERDAQIKVRMVETLDEGEGITRYTLSEGAFARAATIEIVRPRWVDVGSSNVQYRSSTVSRLAAHEMGHALGIVRHTTNPGTMMLPVSATDFPSQRDVNTIKAKYCELFPR
jgi:hypothetical protein